MNLSVIDYHILSLNISLKIVRGVLYKRGAYIKVIEVFSKFRKYEIPFWLQKSIKNTNFVDANVIFLKYGPSAFQNRSGNVFWTFSSYFTTF